MKTARLATRRAKDMLKRGYAKSVAKLFGGAKRVQGRRLKLGVIVLGYDKKAHVPTLASSDDLGLVAELVD